MGTVNLEVTRQSLEQGTTSVITYEIARLMREVEELRIAVEALKAKVGL